MPPRRSSSGLPALTLVHAEALLLPRCGAQHACAAGAGAAEPDALPNERVIYFLLAEEAEGASCAPLRAAWLLHRVLASRAPRSTA